MYNPYLGNYMDLGEDVRAYLERDNIFPYSQDNSGINSLYQTNLADITSSMEAPAPDAQPQGLEALLQNIGIDPGFINQYTQARFYGNEEDGKDLGEQYGNMGRPSFLGFTGDLSAQTGRNITDQDPGNDSTINRAETYQDVLNAYRNLRSQEGA